MNVLAFNIKTIPDIEGGRRLYDLQGLTDKEVANVMFHKRRQETGTEFLRLHLHRIVAISAVVRSPDGLKVWTLADEQSSETEIMRQFFKGIEQDVPQLVSWNGNGFDLPVLHYRSIIYGVQAPLYWQDALNSQNRHIDIMNVLAGDKRHTNTPLDEIAILLNLPGKLGMNSEQVWDNYQSGDMSNIRNGCEIDALNIYLVYLRFELINGQLSDEEYAKECEQVKTILIKENKPHLTEYNSCWKN